MISAQLVADLRVHAKERAGNTVSGVLPVERLPSPGFDPDPSTGPHLPGLDEADENGRVGLQPFLSALVVQLAAAAERDHGPIAVERLVSQVGANVGVQIEAAHRAVGDDDQPLDVDDIADLLIELKAAIHGDFFVVDADEERIVLGNRRCPFGEAVQHAPSLCRMTSSVVGGIARRNRGAAAVDISQRIAIGDPECRVTPVAARARSRAAAVRARLRLLRRRAARRVGPSGWPATVPVAMLGTPPR
jgi:predicted ArsR family transcriptional regulator